MPVREGKLQCSSCHNPHGTITEKLIAENSVNELCYRCHLDKRGPFLGENPPVRENDTPSRLVVASMPSRVPRGFSPRFGRPLAGPSPPALPSSRGPFPTSYPVVAMR